MNNPRYAIENHGFEIKSKATGKVVAQAHAQFPLPDELREADDGPRRIYHSPEVLLKRLLKRAVLAGDHTGGGYRILHDGTAIVDSRGQVVVRATPLYPGDTYRAPDGEMRQKMDATPEAAVVNLLVEDAAGSWFKDRWSDRGYERAYKDATLRVERTQEGWMALRDTSILSRHNAPVFFESATLAMTAAQTAHCAPAQSAYKFSFSASIAARKGDYK